MDLPRAEVGIARGIRSDLAPETFEFATPNIGEAFSIAARSRTLAEINRNLKLTADAIRKLPRERDAIIHRRPLDGNERHDVGRTQPRVFALVDREIDEVARLRDAGVS